jgi:thiamine-phosphate pyrophosphorylase
VRVRAAFSLYLITDRRLAKSGLVAACDDALAAASNERVRAAVQLREKDLGGRELLELARELRRICSARDALLLINDRIDVALACGADGVHFAADSFSIADARELLGPSKLIGCSTHGLEEVKSSARAGADFAVFGPVYDPISKRAYRPACGVEAIRAACAASTIPVYALGGITADRIRELQDSGIAGVSVIGSVFGDDSPGDATRHLLRELRGHLF